MWWNGIHEGLKIPCSYGLVGSSPTIGTNTFMSKKFTRKIEDFTCENCGQLNLGNGYTNHCRYCLFSKHVDINPGDRASNCRGLMEPIAVSRKNGEYIINHRCLKCKFEKNNKIAPDDNFELILKIAAQN